MEDFDKNNNKISLTSQCDKKYHKIKTHPETGIFLYKSIKWKTLEKSDYLRKKPGHVVDPDLFLVVALLEVSKYVLGVIHFLRRRTGGRGGFQKIYVFLQGGGGC